MLEGWTRGHSLTISCGYCKSVQVFSPSPQFICNLCWAVMGLKTQSSWYKNKKMPLFHRSDGKGCPRWVSAQLRVGWFWCHVLLRLGWVWTLLSGSWEGLRNAPVINNYRNFCSAFAASYGLGHAPWAPRGREDVILGCQKPHACVACR